VIICLNVIYGDFGLVIFDIFGYKVASKNRTDSMIKQTNEEIDIHVIIDQMNIQIDSALLSSQKYV